MSSSLAQQLNIIAQILEETGVCHWVVSPGSRNAPIVAALLRNPQMSLFSAADERSGAFIALGIAQSHQYPVGFLCTSGTALVNAFPAVCEAYYQRIPLLIISADRPEHLIDQWDGQTIRQNHIFGTYSRHSIHINPRKSILNDTVAGIYHTIERSLQPIPGPVHLNIALDEPIYEGIESPSITPATELPPFVFKSVSTYPAPSIELLLNKIAQFPALPANPTVAILIGQSTPNATLSRVLSQIELVVPVFADVCSHQNKHGLKLWDWGLLKRDLPNNLRPDIIITLGTAMISKPLKQKISQWKPAHIHIGEFGEIGDPFQTRPLHWEGHESDILETLRLALESNPTWESAVQEYCRSWTNFLSTQTLQFEQLPPPFNQEIRWLDAFFKSINRDTTIIQMGNSMPIRYASWIQFGEACLYANRGVSGIDGSVSTAVGCALANPDKHIYAIMGDVSSIYDSNALWTNIPENFTLIIINNQGGRIFDWIPGPNKYPELRPFIHTPKSVDFQFLASFYGLPYRKESISQVPLVDNYNGQLPGGIIELV